MDLEIFNKLANNSSAISEVLNDYAKKLDGAKTQGERNAIKQEFFQHVKSAISEIVPGARREGNGGIGEDIKNNPSEVGQKNIISEGGTTYETQGEGFIPDTGRRVEDYKGRTRPIPSDTIFLSEDKDNKYNIAQASRQAVVGKLKTNVKRVKSWIDAVRILAPFRNESQEVVTALFTDKEGTPLAVLKSTRGTIFSTQIDFVSLLGPAHSMEGVEKVWYAHNHPSGGKEPSAQDIKLTKDIDASTKGTGIEAEHILLPAGDNIRGILIKKDGTTEEVTLNPDNKKTEGVPLIEY